MFLLNLGTKAIRNGMELDIRTTLKYLQKNYKMRFIIISRIGRRKVYHMQLRVCFLFGYFLVSNCNNKVRSE